MTTPTPSGRTAVRGAVSTLTGQWVKLALQVLTVVVLARLLDPVDYGIMAMVVAVTGAAVVFGDLGLATAAVQSSDLSNQSHSNLFWINSFVGLCASASVYLLSHVAGQFFHNPYVEPAMQLVSICFLLEGAGAQYRAHATRRLMFHRLGVADVAGQFAALVVSVALALLGFGYWALAWQVLVLSLVRLIAITAYVRWRPMAPRRGHGTAKLVKFGAATACTQLLHYVTASVDNLIVGRLFGSYELGLYSRAYTLSRLPYGHFTAPLTRVALPTLARLTDEDAFKRYVYRAQRTLMYSLGAIFGVGAGLAVPVVACVLGSKWVPAAPLFAILCVAGMFQGLASVNYWILTSRGHVAGQLRWELVGRALTVGIIIVGSLAGTLGVAVGVVVGLFLAWLAVHMFALSRSGLSRRKLAANGLFPVAVFGPLAAVGLLSAVSGVPNLGVLTSSVLSVVFVFLYLGGVWLCIKRFRTDVRALVTGLKKHLARTHSAA